MNVRKGITDTGHGRTGNRQIGYDGHGYQRIKTGLGRLGASSFQTVLINDHCGTTPA